MRARPCRAHRRIADPDGLRSRPVPYRRDGPPTGITHSASMTRCPKGSVQRSCGPPQSPRKPFTHGFQSTFRAWAAEETNHPREVVEAASAHVAHNRVEAANARSDPFERRWGQMDDWSAYVAEGTTEDSSRTRNHDASLHGREL